MSLEGEKRPVDAADEIAGINAEAAELLEHIEATDPRWKREELLQQAIDMIDDAHKLALKTHMELEDE